MARSGSALGGLPPILTAAEAADVLRVSRKTVFRWIAAGRMRAGRSAMGGSGKLLIARSELERLLGELGIEA